MPPPPGVIMQHQVGDNHGIQRDAAAPRHIAQGDDEARRALQEIEGHGRRAARFQDARLRAHPLQRHRLPAAQGGEERQAVTGRRHCRAPRGDQVSEGFNLGYCRALPGKGPMLHNHDTNETFIAMTGTWRASWENERGRLEHVDLNPLDLISFPPGASRRFMNVTKGPKNKPSILMFVIGGDAPSAEFTSESMRRIEAAGAMPRQRKTMR